MPDTNVQIALTLTWVGHPEEAPWVVKRRRPSTEGLVQLFYGLNLLYAESLDLEAEDSRLQHRTPALRPGDAAPGTFRRALAGGACRPDASLHSPYGLTPRGVGRPRYGGG